MRNAVPQAICIFLCSISTRAFHSPSPNCFAFNKRHIRRQLQLIQRTTLFPTNMVSGVNIDADSGWNPLILSTIAGMSTCLGALIVFCHPIEEEETDTRTDEETAQLTNNDNSLAEAAHSKNNEHRSFRVISKGRRKVKPSTMAFSLALAGSVMITVSIVSIGPECLALQGAEENSVFIFGITLMPINSWPFVHRVLSFGLGCFLYYLMSKYAFPEPEEILSTHSETLLNSTGVPIQRSFSDSSKCSDDEEETHQSSKNHVGNVGSESATTSSASLMRRGAGSVEMVNTSNDRPAKDDLSPGKCKAIFRESVAEQKSWLSFLRSFTTGSDLSTPEARRANRVAMLLFFSLLIHNFPEGLAVAASALESDQLGLTVTVGIMIHNIPEGIAIAIPCLKARPDSPWLSFVLASVSGLAEPAGAFLSLVILRGSNGQVFGGEGSLENVLAFVAGIMITVSTLELLPEAKRHAENSDGMKAFYLGIVVGFVVMVATELGMSI
jgi:ZIP family zinc transporter